MGMRMEAVVKIGVIGMLWLVAICGGSALAADGRQPMGGAACVMAKWQGNTLDYALVTGKAHPVEAQEAAEAILREKGYANYKKNVDVLHPQALTNLPHAFVVVIKSTFTTGAFKSFRGRERTSYGCGFSGNSYDEALWEAIRDLQSHSWGWKPDRDGYQEIERKRY